MVRSKEATWVQVPLDSEIERRPVHQPLVPLTKKLDLLPLDLLEWPDFEGLLWRVMRDVEGLRNPQIYGLAGQKQQGLDLVAEASDGSGVALQSKRVKKFPPAKITAAVDEFRTTRRPFPVSRFILGVSTEVRSTQAVDRFKQLREELGSVELVMWDQRELSAMLKDAPRIVIDYFGSQVAEAFCRPFVIGTPVVPSENVVAVREAMARTPEVTTGAGAKIESAKSLAASDPSAALVLVEEAQQALTDAGFTGHAVQHEALRSSLLVKAGRGVEATRRRLDQFWVALDQGQNGFANLASGELRKLASQTNKKVAGEHAAVAEMALRLYENPMAHVPALTSLALGDPTDRARLAALAGEIALADGNQGWLASNAMKLRRLSERLPGEASEDVLRARLRILAAEGSGKWASILQDARTLKLSYELIGLVNARHARYLARQQKFEQADIAWDEASGAACLAQRWTDAARWTFCRRAFRTRWKPFTTDELLPMQTALLSRGPDATVMPRDDDAVEQALRKMADGKLRPAAIAAQRALRDAVALSDWAGEDQARRVLADVLHASGEPREAARHLVRAGSVEGVKRLAAAVGDTYLDVTDHLGARTYWEVGAAYRLIAHQADLVPDETVPIVVDAVVRDLETARSGKLVDLSIMSGSRFLGAIAAVAGLSERLNVQQAEKVLEFFEAQPVVEEHHYRYHDDDEARAVAGIIETHPQLEDRALAHLVPLLARASSSRKSAAYDAVTKCIEKAAPKLEELARSGSHWAREMLATERHESTAPEERQQARVRLEEPLDIPPGVTTVGGGSSAIPDSILARDLPASQQEAAWRELLDRGANPRIDSLDRRSYLLAASNLVPPRRTSVRSELFERALGLVTNPPEYLTDASDAQFAHPLGAFRITGKSDSRGEAAHAAAVLARTEKDKLRARSAALSLLGDESVSELWTTRALQRLGDAMVPDVGFLSGQDWACRSLAGIIWARTGEPVGVGDRLSVDSDPRVRRAIAAELLTVEQERAGDLGGARYAVLERLRSDPRFSVRAVAGAQPRT